MDTPSASMEIAIILVLIVANGIFALTEMAVVSSRKTRLEQRAEEGDAGSKLALELAEEPTPLLSTIQVGITLIGILTGTFGGATLSKVLSEELKVIPAIAAHSEAISLAIVVTAITYLTLIFGELVPKRIALNNPEPIAATLAGPMHTFSKISAPVVHFLSSSTDMVMRFLGIKQTAEAPVTEDEIRILLEQGTEAGAFEKAEQDMVDKVFRLSDLRAYSLMTPRTRMVWIDLEDSLENNQQIIYESGHSRFPVAIGSLDNFQGIIYTKDLLSRCLEGEPLDFENSIKSPLYIPKSMKAFKVLELFKQTGVHEAVVLDEFGGVVGFITLHDIMEEIIGDMPSVDDEDEEPQIIERQDGTWLADGLISIEDFKDKFDIEELPEEDRDHFNTLGGFVVSYLGHIPTASESFVWDEFRFEVVDMDRVRVDKVLISRVPPAEEQSA
ncbi:MAG: hemolysin family protein [Negativicutes bacterium]